MKISIMIKIMQISTIMKIMFRSTIMKLIINSENVQNDADDRYTNRIKYTCSSSTTY